jgi:hypothetical protein
MEHGYRRGKSERDGERGEHLSTSSTVLLKASSAACVDSLGKALHTAFHRAVELHVNFPHAASKQSTAFRPMHLQR